MSFCLKTKEKPEPSQSKRIFGGEDKEGRAKVLALPSAGWCNLTRKCFSSFENEFPEPSVLPYSNWPPLSKQL